MSSTVFTSPTVDKFRAQDIEIVECENDIPEEYVYQIKKIKSIAWDIETTGLNWRKDVIGTCQLYIPNGTVVVVKVRDIIPVQLISLLADASVQKVFHHAMFDLRFMSYRWKVTPLNIVCTKIASKLLDTNAEGEHSLRTLLKRHLGLWIDKSNDIRRSNWKSIYLTQKQKYYAVGDVVFLPMLRDVLHSNLESKNLLWLAYSCYVHIPTQVLLDVLGYKHIYDY